MPERGFALRLTGVFVFGFVMFILSALLVFVLSPFILPAFAAIFPFLAGTFLFIVAVFVVWGLSFMFSYMGIAIYYAIKHPMKISKHGSYTIDSAKEAGRRQKSKSRKK